jgi:hypothetical protein
MIEGVFDEKKKKCEKRLYFKLEDRGMNNILIKVVDEEGLGINAPYICGISKTTGKIKREMDVNKTIGFDLDEYGRVKVE